jgi:hypothetical protein
MKVVKVLHTFCAFALANSCVWSSGMVRIPKAQSWPMCSRRPNPGDWRSLDPESTLYMDLATVAVW